MTAQAWDAELAARGTWKKHYERGVGTWYINVETGEEIYSRGMLPDGARVVTEREWEAIQDAEAHGIWRKHYRGRGAVYTNVETGEQVFSKHDLPDDARVVEGRGWDQQDDGLTEDKAKADAGEDEESGDGIDEVVH